MNRQLKSIDEISSSIKKARKLRHMTQEEAAELLGYSERQYRRFENEGAYDIFVLSNIAELFRVDLINILFK